MRSVEVAQKAREALRLKSLVEARDLRIVEIHIPDGSEYGEYRVRGRRGAGRESRAVEQNTCGTLAQLGDSRSYARASGKAGEIHATLVDR